MDVATAPSVDAAAVDAPVAAAPGMPPSRRPWRAWVLPVALLLAAEAAMHGRPPSDSIAAPSQVAAALGRSLLDGSLWLASLQTLGAALGGLVVGGGAGLLIGLGFGLSRRVATGGALSVELLKPVPSVALIPIALLVFGFGWRLEISVVASAVLFPMLILTQAAVRSVSPRLIEVSRVLGLTGPQRLWKIFLPAALPRIFVALRLAVGIALVVAVTTEIASNPQGLGYALMSAQQSLAPDLMLAHLVWVGLLGWGASAGLTALQRRWFGASAPGAGR